MVARYFAIFNPRENTMKTTKILSLTLALSIAGQTCAIGLPSWLTKSTVQGVKAVSMAPAPSLQTVQKLSAPLATIIASPLAQMAKPSSFDKYKNIILSRNGLYVIGGVFVTLLIASCGLLAKKQFWPQAPDQTTKNKKPIVIDIDKNAFRVSDLPVLEVQQAQDRTEKLKKLSREIDVENGEKAKLELRKSNFKSNAGKQKIDLIVNSIAKHNLKIESLNKDIAQINKEIENEKKAQEVKEAKENTAKKIEAVKEVGAEIGKGAFNLGSKAVTSVWGFMKFGYNKVAGKKTAELKN